MMNGNATLPPKYHLPRAPTPEELQALLDVPKRSRDQAMIHLMAGCGLRVSEVCGLRMENIIWSNGNKSLRFVGKGGRERIVPMNLEVQDSLRAWLEERPSNGVPHLFIDLKTNSRPISRKTVYAFLDRYAERAGIRHVHPHMLRHYFGTSLADRGVPIERIRGLMGHASITSSSIYIAVSAEQKRQAVELLDRRSRIRRWISRQRNRAFQFFSGTPKQPVFSKNQTVGRRKEIRTLQINLEKGIDTLVIGPTGVGKSRLLDLLESEKMIKLKTFSPLKQSVITIAEYLFNKGNLNHGVEFKEDEYPNFETVKKKLVRTSIKEWVDMILESVEKDEWVLLIDDISDVSRTMAKTIAQLNSRFIIFAAATEIKKQHEQYFWKFDRLELGNLTKADAAQLIKQCTQGVDVQDYRLLQTHVLQMSDGNPRAIIEIVERLRKEPSITNKVVREISHSGAMKKIDLTPAFIVLGAVVIASRFIARGLGSIDGYMLAGAGSALFMVLRFFSFRMRR